MTETKPRYELKRRDQRGYYVLLCEGEHNLCAVCTKTTRGALDAQLLLLAMNSHKELLELCMLVGDITELWLDDVGKSQYGGPEGFDVFIRALIYKAKWILAKAKPSNGENGGRNE